MTKRVFFISSYIMLCKLLIIDEPQLENRKHTRLLQKLVELNRYFRVLCVSITAGRTIDEKLLRKWIIANVEL